MTRTERTTAAGRFGPLAIAIVTVSLVVWPIAFNLGAYSSVFYDDLFRFVVAATAGLAVTFVAPAYHGDRLWLTRLALATPVAWMVVAVTLFDSVAEAATNGLFGVLLLVTAVVSIPVVVKMLIDMFVPELRSTERVGHLVGAVLVIAGVTVAGLVVGANNDAFLTCDDFKVAGSDEPENCDPT